MFNDIREGQTTGIIIDIETTGLNEGDKIVKFAGVLFEFNKQTEEIIDIIDQYQGTREFRVSSSPGEKEKNSFKNETPEHNEFNQDRIEGMINRADIIITHNIQLVKRFITNLFPEASQKEWIETMEGFPWTEEGFPSKALEEILQALDFPKTSPPVIFDDFKEFLGKVPALMGGFWEKIKTHDLLKAFLSETNEGKSESVRPVRELEGKKKKGIKFKGTINPNPIRKYEVLGPSSEDFNQKTAKVRISTPLNSGMSERKRGSIKKLTVEKNANKKAILFSVTGVLLLAIFITFFSFLGRDSAQEVDQTDLVEESPARLEQVHLSKEEQEYLKEEMLIGMPQVILNFREGPDTEYEIIKQLNPGDTFFVAGEQENWYYIVLFSSAGFEKGWVHKDYVDILEYNPQQDMVMIYHKGPGSEERDNLHLGMNQEQILELLGEPEMTAEKIWYYRGAPLYFNSEEELIGWDNRNEGLDVGIQRRGFTHSELRTIFEEEYRTWIEERE